MRRAAVLVWLAALALAAGCGKPVLREADPSLGDYYTAKEYKKLSKEEREQYCQDLSDQLETYQDQIGEAKDALESISKGTPLLRAEIDSLRALESRLSARLEAERGVPAPASSPAPAEAGLASSYVVKTGDSLWTISAKSTVYGRGDFWERLYEGNRNAIHDPNVIHPGQEIMIPR